MVLDLVLDEEFFSSLTQLDGEMARQVAASGCRWCGGRLHQANYRRKPRGGLLAMAGEAFTIRHSLCCGAEGCRKRSLPPSLRFFGRRVYLEVVVLLACMVAQLMSSLGEACAATGVPRWTLRRWSEWWREAFVRSPTWTVLRARFAPPPPAEADLPRSLVVRIEAELRRRGPPTIADVCLLAARLLAPASSAATANRSRLLGA